MLYWKPVFFVDTTTRAAGSFTGSARSSTAYRTLNAAVLAPIPSARDRHATIVKTGFCTSRRTA